LASIDVRAALPQGFGATAGSLHLLALEPDPDRVAARFGRSSVMRNVRKAQKLGVTVDTGRGRADLTEAFYGLHLTTRRRQGVPIQPRRFFELFWERLIEPGLGRVVVARVDGRAAAAIVLLAWNGTTVYKFGASDPAFSAHRVSNLAMWTGISQACAAGDRVFDFGRTDDDNEGLKAYKRSWGADELPLVYSTLADEAPQDNSGRAQHALGVVLRHSPRWMTRLAGELLYKYAA